MVCSEVVVAGRRSLCCRGSGFGRGSLLAGGDRRLPFDGGVHLFLLEICRMGNIVLSSRLEVAHHFVVMNQLFAGLRR